MSEFSELRIRIRMIGIFFQSAVFTIRSRLTVAFYWSRVSTNKTRNVKNMNIKKLFNIELTSKCFDFLKKAWRFFLFYELQKEGL